MTTIIGYPVYSFIDNVYNKYKGKPFKINIEYGLISETKVLKEDSKTDTYIYAPIQPTESHSRKRIPQVLRNDNDIQTYMDYSINLLKEDSGA